jgi:ComF family protein
MGLTSSVLTLVSEVVGNVLSPPACAACDAPLRAGIVFCAGCVATVVVAPPALDGVVAPYVYGGAIAEAITRFKYGDRPDLARPLGQLLAGATRTLANDCFTHVVPVPLHPVRLSERRFNQSALLARWVASDLGARFAPLALERMRDTPRQATLEREARATNVGGAFRPRRGDVLSGARVLLVDDVTTTGSTLEACRRAVVEGGAMAVRCAVVARAERVHEPGPK